MAEQLERLVKLQQALLPSSDSGRRSRSRGRGSGRKDPRDSDEEPEAEINRRYRTFGFIEPRSYPIKRRKAITKEIYGKRLNLIAQADITTQRVDRLIYIATKVWPDIDMGSAKLMCGSTHLSLSQALVQLAQDNGADMSKVHYNCDNIDEVSDAVGWKPEWSSRYIKIPAASAKHRATASAQEVAVQQLKVVDIWSVS